MDKAARTNLKQRIDSAVINLVDGLGRIAKQIAAPPPELSKPPADVARRHFANTLGLSQFCGRSACRRARCCRGEPLHCLRIAIPLLPPDIFEGLMAKKRPARAKATKAAKTKTPAPAARHQNHANLRP